MGHIKTFHILLVVAAPLNQNMQKFLDNPHQDFQKGHQEFTEVNTLNGIQRNSTYPTAYPYG